MSEKQTCKDCETLEHEICAREIERNIAWGRLALLRTVLDLDPIALLELGERFKLAGLLVEEPPK